MAKKEKCPEKALDDVRETLSDIEGVKVVVITDTKGNLLGHRMSASKRLGIGVPAFAQAMAELMEMAKVTLGDIRGKKPDEIIIATISERIIVMRAGANALVAVRAKPEANQQLILLSILRAAKAIKELMKLKGRKNDRKVRGRKG